MSQKDVYTVLGAGRQGTAAAYDLVRWGGASKVILADRDIEIAQQAALRVNHSWGGSFVEPKFVDVRDMSSVEEVMKGSVACLSAVPYYYNLEITRIALELGVNVCDLGGHIGIARQQHALDAQAKQASISIIPNCGQVPGMGTSLCVYAIELLDEAIDVYMWDGGLPQEPRPPFNYLLTFNIAGLTNEYAEPGVFLRNWKITEVQPMTELESVEFPAPIGKLEAFVTGGGTDTMPWTYEGKLRTLQNLTLRYPGNYSQLRAFYDLGLWRLDPIQVGGKDIVPRDVFHTLFEPYVTYTCDKDVVIVRVKAIGKKDGRDAEALVEVIDTFDIETGFTAMERSTGWSAAIVTEMMANNQTPRGAGGVEKMVPARLYVDELNKRGIQVTQELTYP
jgi:lysine 6-dehydrogenase